MHINDIKGFAAKVALDRAFQGKGIPVIVSTEKVKGTKLYLQRDGTWSTNRATACPYDYDFNRVGEQVEQAAQIGIVLDVEAK